MVILIFESPFSPHLGELPVICGQERWKELKLLAHLSLAPRAGGRLQTAWSFTGRERVQKREKDYKGEGGK